MKQKKTMRTLIMNHESSAYESYDSDCEIDKSYEYLSDGEDEVIQLRKRIIENKHTTSDEHEAEEQTEDNDNDTPEVVDGPGPNGLGPLVRQHERFMEGLFKHIRGNGVGITDPFSVVHKSKKGDNYPIYDDDTH